MSKFFLISVLFVSCAFGQGAGMRQLKYIDGKDYVCTTNAVTLISAERSLRTAGDLAGSNYTASAVSSASATQAATNTMFSQWFSAIQGRTNAWDAAFGWGDWSARVAALDGRSNTWNRAAAAAGYAYSPTNKPALGTDTVARALGWYAYSPTNRPSASDIGAATLADVSAAIDRGVPYWKSQNGDSIATIENDRTVLLWEVAYRWRAVDLDIPTNFIVEGMPYPTVVGDWGIVKIEETGPGLYNLYFGATGSSWSDPYEKSYIYNAGKTITAESYSTNLISRFATTNDLADFITQAQSDTRYVPITSGVSTNQTLVNASVTGDLAVDAIRGKTSAGTFIRSLSGAPCASFGLGSGSNVMITNTQSSGYFQHTGTLTLNGDSISAWPTGGGASSLTPLVNVATGAVITVAWSNAPSVAYLNLTGPATITNDLSALSLNCSSNASKQFVANVATWSATNITWDARMIWRDGVPDISMTGRWSFVCETACGTNIFATQTFPAVYMWRNSSMATPRANANPTAAGVMRTDALTVSETNSFVLSTCDDASRPVLFRLHFINSDTDSAAIQTFVGVSYAYTDSLGVTTRYSPAYFAATTGTARDKLITYYCPPVTNFNSLYSYRYSFEYYRTNTVSTGVMRLYEPQYKWGTPLHASAFNAGWRP